MYLNFVNNFRAVAIAYIVLGHCIDAFFWPPASVEERFLRIIFSNGTVFFVFIAGFLFQHLSNKFSYNNYLLKKFKNVILPYIIISIPAVFFFTFVSSNHRVFEVNQYSPGLKILFYYITGKHLVTFWFIPMITVYYFLSIVFLKLEKMKVLYLLLPVLVGISTIIPRGDVVNSFFHFLSVYILGMFCSYYRKPLMIIIDKWLLALILLFIWLTYIELFYYGVFSYLNYISKLVMTLIWLGVLNKYDHKIKTSIQLLASYSFGLYFLHSYVNPIIKIIFTKKLGEPMNIEGSFIFVLVYKMIVIAICIGIIKIVKRTFKHQSRYLIGC